jgi:hypothetical protein
VTFRLLLASIAIAIGGCAAEAIHLYPVDASIAGQPPKPILSGTIVYVGPSATISFHLPDGEKFSGTCTSGSAAGVNDDLKATWDSVYGQGDYLAHVVGAANHCTAKLTGSKQTIFRLEAYNEAPGPLLKGMAEDSNGNIFKMAF